MTIGQGQSLEQQLFAALEDHKDGNLAALLLAGADPDARNAIGQTALEYAFHASCPNELRMMLLEGGADVGPVTDWIAWAVEFAPPEVLQRFLDAGADVDQPSTLGRPLQIAARLGRHDAVEILLRAGADPDAGNESGNPLAEAIELGHSACALRLLAAGADPDRAGRWRPVLATAALRGLTDVVGALVGAGAAIDARATLLQDDVVLDELSRAFDAVFPESHAAAGPKAVSSPGRPQKIRYASATPLLVAAAEGHAETVRCLTELGADLEAVDDTLRTPFQWAQARGHTSVVVALLDAGADPQPVLPAALRLLVAAEKGDMLQVRSLVSEHTPLETRDPRLATRGHTALMLAAARGHEPVVDTLLGAGADVDATVPADGVSEIEASLVDRVAGRTALMLAAHGGHGRVVIGLLGAGAAVGMRDAGGRTARDLAAAAGHGQIVELLDEASQPDAAPEPATAAEPAPAKRKPRRARAAKKPAKKKKATKRKATKTKAARKKKATKKKASRKKKATTKKAAKKKVAKRKTTKKKTAKRPVRKKTSGKTVRKKARGKNGKKKAARRKARKR